MVMKKEEEIIVYQNPDPLLVSRQGIFPGVSLLPNNDLLIIFSIGQAFDSSDQRAFVTKSSDNGRTWSKPKDCLLYTSPSPRDVRSSRMPSSA